MFLLALVLGCSCNETDSTVIAPKASHFGTFHGLVNAATQGDVEGAKWIARSLQEARSPNHQMMVGGPRKWAVRSASSRSPKTPKR